MQVIELSSKKVRVVEGPFNTTCHKRDIWEVKERLKELVGKKLCPTCKQEVKCTTAP